MTGSAATVLSDIKAHEEKLAFNYTCVRILFPFQNNDGSSRQIKALDCHVFNLFSVFQEYGLLLQNNVFCAASLLRPRFNYFA